MTIWLIKLDTHCTIYLLMAYFHLQMGAMFDNFCFPTVSHLAHWDGNWSYRSYIMADAEAAEKGGLFQTVVF